MRFVLYQPDIPQNLGSAIRLAACLEVSLDIIEPCGFPLNDKAIKRAAMDYGGCADVSRHDSWEKFKIWRASSAPASRVILFTTKSASPYCDFLFQPDDILLFGRESAGVPEDVHAYTDARLFIPISAQARSINVINSASMALGEALRQTNTFPVRP
ncbi:tRNA (cytidine(34)-2'-O)-methyltransferase [Asticcacaulis endophyticus]|uniref:tRNA (cytidine(34)-2'-O)-methyltransferase n=1 Tax=Asticcacaulis endophyticus TaxID=1395890 RepID=A0A918UV27_9CAUL|nr:tRNA (cytidine(34)-2'-O)-methyltransferase [Asticcacaulis endophyticus]GGZ36393.1 tRNA (cytidine(34)-2'-O)-methyltransferase [Asticcacaulis endophyticus]